MCSLFNVQFLALIWCKWWITFIGEVVQFSLGLVPENVWWFHLLIFSITFRSSSPIASICKKTFWDSWFSQPAVDLSRLGRLTSYLLYGRMDGNESKYRPHPVLQVPSQKVFEPQEPAPDTISEGVWRLNGSWFGMYLSTFLRIFYVILCECTQGPTHEASPNFLGQIWLKASRAGNETATRAMSLGSKLDHWEISRIQLMEVRKRTIFLAIFCWDIPLHRPKKWALYMVGTSNQSVPLFITMKFHCLFDFQCLMENFFGLCWNWNFQETLNLVGSWSMDWFQG